MMKNKITEGIVHYNTCDLNGLLLLICKRPSNEYFLEEHCLYYIEVSPNKIKYIDYIA